MSEQNFIVYYIFSFLFFLLISHTSQMHAPIELGSLSASLHSSFGWNLMEIYRVMTDFFGIKSLRSVTPT